MRFDFALSWFWVAWIEAHSLQSAYVISASSQLDHSRLQYDRDIGFLYSRNTIFSINTFVPPGEYLVVLGSNNKTMTNGAQNSLLFFKRLKKKGAFSLTANGKMLATSSCHAYLVQTVGKAQWRGHLPSPLFESLPQILSTTNII